MSGLLPAADRPKFQAACQIASEALMTVMEACVPDADVFELCRLGDKAILEGCTKVFQKKVKGEAVKKGVCLPTCVSPDEMSGLFNPSAEESVKLKEGQLVTIELGCHVGGYPATVGHTVVVGSTPVDDERARLIKALWTASEAAARMMKAGNHNNQITAVINEVAEEFGVQPMNGVLSHQMKQFILDSNKCIINKETPEEKVPNINLEVDEVYGLHIVFTTGEGKAKTMDVKPNVYKRDMAVQLEMRTQRGRLFLREVEEKTPTFPFSMNAVDPANKGGVLEALRGGHVIPYPVIKDCQKGALTAAIQLTVQITANGPRKTAGVWTCHENAPLNFSQEIKSESLKTLLASELPTNKKN